MMVFLQADETKIGCLAPEMNRLLRKLLVKFVRMRHVKAQADVRDVDFASAELQHDDDLLAVGLQARTMLDNTDDPIEDATKAKFFG